MYLPSFVKAFPSADWVHKLLIIYVVHMFVCVKYDSSTPTFAHNPFALYIGCTKSNFLLTIQYFLKYIILLMEYKYSYFQPSGYLHLIISISKYISSNSYKLVLLTKRIKGKNIMDFWSVTKARWLFKRSRHIEDVIDLASQEK